MAEEAPKYAGSMEPPESLDRKMRVLHGLGIRLASWSSGGSTNAPRRDRSNSFVINVDGIDTVEAELPTTTEVRHLTPVNLEPAVTAPDGIADVPPGPDTTQVEG
jgi:hypothetical protein